MRAIQCSEVSQCHRKVLGSHSEIVDWVCVVYRGLLLRIAVSCWNRWWRGQMWRAGKSKANPLPPLSSIPSTLYKLLAHTQRPPEQKLSQT